MKAIEFVKRVAEHDVVKEWFDEPTRVVLKRVEIYRATPDNVTYAPGSANLSLNEVREIAEVKLDDDNEVLGLTFRPHTPFALGIAVADVCDKYHIRWRR